METYQPIVAIVGNPLSVPALEQSARQACNYLGQEFARNGWRIAVYTSDKYFIEQDVITGYVEIELAEKKSIVCYYPQGVKVHFPEMEAFKEKEYFEEFVDPSIDWEVSFYRSLTKVDGILLLGGGPTTLIAGQIALSRDLPVIAIAHFGGSALKIWQHHLSSKPAFLEDSDIQIMGRWNENSPKEFVNSLNQQRKRRLDKIETADKELSKIKNKAESWDEYERNRKEDKAQTSLAIVFLIAFVVFLIIGLVTNPPGWAYSLLTILGLCFAGGFGATVRMLTPNAPTSKKWVPTILGIAVGLVFSLLYLIPQLIQNSGFLIPSETDITNAVRVQYISSLIVSFLAGLGFDLAVGQLLKKAEQSGNAITKLN